ncbi:agouti-signaling protein-like [Solea senegalensis]|uniref:Agouti-signaling protein-like n=1 Tax=Solea senegalensis TaxID=28829 RepID=A0AAV6T451_SOLSE|nr:agouti-related protein-like isoform X2 [Solea senegalensis]KAG7524117.1 agouti-signaling protein-like [Solea senegalensis]
MKLAIFFLVVLHVAFINGALFARSAPQRAYNNLPSSDKGDRATAGTGTLIYGRQRPLFARRGQYERQSVPKFRVSHASPIIRPPPPKVTPKPVKPTCSQLAQSCLPLSGCCDPHTSCHCRFFNAICFCRKTNLQHEKKS